MKNLRSFLYSILLAIVAGVGMTTVAAQVTDNPTILAIDAREASAGVFVARTIYHLAYGAPERGVAGAGVSTEIWENFIASNLWKNYGWVKKSKDRTGYVINNAIVYIPQAGARPNVVRNRTTYPITVTLRTDDVILYEIDKFSTDTIVIQDAERVELSYDKVADVMNDHMMALEQTVAQWTAYFWSASNAANIVRTTGGTVAAHLSTATGNRKKLLAVDLESAKTVLIDQTKREQGMRNALMSETMYLQLKNDSTVLDRDTQDAIGAVFRDGDLVKLHGFNIIRTDVMPRFDNTATPVIKEPGSAAATTDNDCVLCWDEAFVHFAMGSIKFFEDKDNTEFQGDAYNALVRAGSSKEREDQAGVCMIVQTAV